LEFLLVGDVVIKSNPPWSPFAKGDFAGWCFAKGRLHIRHDQSGRKNHKMSMVSAALPTKIAAKIIAICIGEYVAGGAHWLKFLFDMWR
jgi:hypothetical protein